MGKAIKKAQEIAAETAEKTTEDTTPSTAPAGMTTEEVGDALKEAAAAMAAPEPPAVTLDELEGMDMNTFNQEETEGAPRPAWRITDDGCADWAVRKIAEEKAELDRIKALAESQIAAGGRNTQPPTQSGQNGHTGAQKPLSEAQLSRMYRKGEDAGVTKEQIDERIAQKYGQQDPHYMTRAQYDETCNALDAQAKKGGTANA